jgi:hypothetical protein
LFFQPEISVLVESGELKRVVWVGRKGSGSGLCDWVEEEGGKGEGGEVEKGEGRKEGERLDL